MTTPLSGIRARLLIVIKIIIIIIIIIFIIFYVVEQAIFTYLSNRFKLSWQSSLLNMDVDLCGCLVNGRYSVDCKIQSGYFGTTWKALDQQTKTDVCLKVISS